MNPVSKPYRKPELICYGKADVGYYSPSNTAAQCQANCAANDCTLVADPLTGCQVCDAADTCGTFAPAAPCGDPPCPAPCQAPAAQLRS